MEAVLNSFGLVFVGEIGDKTQLLALLLVARYRRPWTILFGVFIATVLNHALASWVGATSASLLATFDPRILKYALASAFFAFATWMLIPDTSGDDRTSDHFGVLITTIVVFFFAEMGDKTQLATVALAMRYANIGLVTLGSTMGMMASNSIAVFIGEKAIHRISLKWVRIGSAFLFFLFGVSILAT